MGRDENLICSPVSTIARVRNSISSISRELMYVAVMNAVSSAADISSLTTSLMMVSVSSFESLLPSILFLIKSSDFGRPASRTSISAPSSRWSFSLVMRYTPIVPCCAIVDVVSTNAVAVIPFAELIIWTRSPSSTPILRASARFRRTPRVAISSVFTMNFMLYSSTGYVAHGQNVSLSYVR